MVARLFCNLEEASTYLEMSNDERGKLMSDQNKKNDLGPTPWGSDPIRGLNYDYLDIDKPPAIDPKPVVPERTEYNAIQAKDFYQQVRSKIVKWAQGAGAGKETTKYIL